MTRSVISVQSFTHAGNANRRGTVDLTWTRQIGTSSGDYSNSVAVDSNNNVYISGYSAGNLGGETNLGSGDAFLIKHEVVSLPAAA